jgi:hypothetical protein
MGGNEPARQISQPVPLIAGESAGVRAIEEELRYFAVPAHLGVPGGSGDDGIGEPKVVDIAGSPSGGASAGAGFGAKGVGLKENYA